MSKILQGHRTKLNKTKKKQTKTTEAPTVSRGCADSSYTVQYNHDCLSLSNDDRKSTVFSSRRNVVSDGAFLTDDGRLFHARADATGKARSLSV